jgi:hypothetical protein
MKLTLVIDTDDPDGVLDTLKIAQHFARKCSRRPGREVQYSMIAFVKMLRQFAQDAKAADQIGTDFGSLKFTKQWADKEFARQNPGLVQWINRD